MKTSNSQNECVVLSHYEWEHLKRRSEQPIRKPAENEQLAERKRKSNIISQNWPNKISEIRKKQLEAQRNREELRERDRQQQDIEEEQFQSQRRREIIENAKKLLYCQTERIRKLHGALLLAQVLKEREQQIEVNKKKTHLYDNIETKYLENLRRQCDEDAKEKQIQEERKRKEKQQLADELTKQMSKKEIQKKQLEEDGFKMREELKEQDEQYVDQLLNDLLNKEEKKKKLLYEQRLQQLEQKKIRENNDRKNFVEYKKAELYEEAKRKLQKMREERDKQQFLQKQELLQKLREQQSQQLVQKVQEEEERYKKQVEEKEATAKEQEESRKLSKKQALQDCLAHCKLQIVHQHRRADAVKKATALELKQLKDDYQSLQKEVLQKQEREYRKQKNHKLALAQQINEKKEKDMKEKAKENIKELELYKDLAMEEDMFHDYVNKMLDDVKKKGYNLLPLLKASEPGIGFGRGPVYKDRANIRPPYQASDASGAPLQYILPLNEKLTSTSERLGLQQ